MQNNSAVKAQSKSLRLVFFPPHAKAVLMKTSHTKLVASEVKTARFIPCRDIRFFAQCDC